MPEAKTEYKRPLPRRHGHAKEFYEFCRKHELRFQRCIDCSAWRHLPRDMCAQCGSFRWQWAQSTGRGTVFSWTTVEQPMLRQFADVPYSPVVIELAEGVRMISWLMDVKPEDLRLGLPVEVAFDDVTPEVTLPKFKRAAAA
ncbi:MAG TPA: OB-fold domain-containing protein [Candidatus Binataceae bacterium]|nr:OB-fold domain-containing protein [Candidatus Binataceae bacterium]